LRLGNAGGGAGGGQQGHWDFAALPDGGEKPGSGRVARVTVTANGDKLSVLVENTFAKKGPSSRKSEFERVQ